MSRRSNYLLKVSALSLVSSVFLLSGCGNTLWGSNRTETSSTGSSTAVGAVAGTAVGAGLGAIIGSATGDAGAGVAIGAAAGAVTGGAIGYQVGTQNEQISSQREQLNQQGEQLQLQDQELKELKQKFDSGELSGNRPSRGAESYSFNSYSGSPLAKPLAAGTTTPQFADARSRLSTPFSMSNSANGAVVQSAGMGAGQNAAIEPNAVRRSASYAPRQEIPRAASEVKTLVPPAATAKMTEEVTEEVTETDVETESIDQNLEDMEAAVVEDEAPVSEVTESATKPVIKTPAALPPAVVDTTTLPQTDSEKVAKAAVQAPAGSPCEQAAGEAERARTATSDADKLFYYRRALKLCPTEVSYNIEIASVYSALGKNEDAQFYYRQALDLDPGNEQVLEQLSLLE